MSVREIERLINSLPNKTSYGHDKVSNTLLKSLCTSISYPLQIIFNQSIYQGVFPDKMKLAEIVPLYKGKEQDLVVNYRPISLLMTISKILEKIVYHHFYSFLELNGTLFDSQYGFCSQRSCEQAILEMMGNLLQARNKDLYSSGTFLGLSKAFDTLNHDVLIKKMESYGVRGLTSDWFRSYLSNRSLVAMVKTNPSTVTYSEPYHITYGTAQGSCLGPLLFILFCNDIKLLPLYGKLTLFADDTTLLNTHCNKNFVQYSIVHDLDTLMNWFKANQLSLNLSKTVVLNFWEHKDGGFITIDGTELLLNLSKTVVLNFCEHKDGGFITIDGTEIPLVNNAEFLGVHLNS